MNIQWQGNFHCFFAFIYLRCQVDQSLQRKLYVNNSFIWCDLVFFEKNDFQFSPCRFVKYGFQIFIVFLSKKKPKSFNQIQCLNHFDFKMNPKKKLFISASRLIWHPYHMMMMAVKTKPNNNKNEFLFFISVFLIIFLFFWIIMFQHFGLRWRLTTTKIIV